MISFGVSSDAEAAANWGLWASQLVLWLLAGFPREDSSVTWVAFGLAFLDGMTIKPTPAAITMANKPIKCQRLFIGKNAIENDQLSDARLSMTLRWMF